MNKKKDQLNLFIRFTDPIHEIKRQIRNVLTETRYSRQEIVDKMNALSSDLGRHKTVTKATLDAWCRDSDQDRMPSLFWMSIFCRTLETVAPIEPMVDALGCGILLPEEVELMGWARAEVDKKKAIKRARIAYEVMNDGN